MKIGENLYVKIDNNATDKCYTQGDLGERKMKLNTKVRDWIFVQRGTQFCLSGCRGLGSFNFCQSKRQEELVYHWELSSFSGFNDYPLHLPFFVSVAFSFIISIWIFFVTFSLSQDLPFVLNRIYNHKTEHF